MNRQLTPKETAIVFSEPTVCLNLGGDGAPVSKKIVIGSPVVKFNTEAPKTIFVFNDNN